MKTCYALLGAATLLAAPNLFANISYDGTYTGTISISPAGGNANGGGEFKATTSPTGGTSSLGVFETFCLNSSAGGHYGTVYNYVSSDTITPGGSAISIGTAWLYSEFRLGNLSTDVATFSYNDASSANSLQAAIWNLQGDADHGSDSLNTLAALLVADAIANALVTDNNYGVFALNLTNGNRANAQPVLGFTSVPEPSTVIAGALLLLPFGVSTLRILRKSKMQ